MCECVNVCVCVSEDMSPYCSANDEWLIMKLSSSSVLVHHSKLNIVVPAHACGNKLKVVIIMLICIGPYTV